MSTHHDICIQGSGIVARTLALLLAKERFRVALVSAAKPESASDVRAYALNAASKNLLESLRVWPDAAHATPVLGMQVHGDTTGRVNFSAAEHGSEALAWIVDVEALEAQLQQAVKYQPLITAIEQEASAYLQDSSKKANAAIRRDLTVICEGKNSVTRDQLGVEFDVTPYHQHAIAARLTGTLPHNNQALQWFKNGDILAFLPLSEAEHGAAGNSVALVWSVAEERANALMALTAEEFAAEVAANSDQALGEMTLYSERATWPLQLARSDKWVGKHAELGSWALAGDAAHTVHPLSGQGLNLGLADVAELAQTLAVVKNKEFWRPVGDLKLLRRYERARKLDALALGTVTDGLQQLFARNDSPLQVLRNWGMQGFERSGGFKQWVTKRAMGL